MYMKCICIWKNPEDQLTVVMLLTLPDIYLAYFQVKKILSVIYGKCERKKREREILAKENQLGLGSII